MNENSDDCVVAGFPNNELEPNVCVCDKNNLI